MPEPQHEHHEHDDEHDDRDQDIFPTVLDSPEDAAAAALARAEQAVARHGGTQEEREGVARAATARRAEERLERWQAGR